MLSRKNIPSAVIFGCSGEVLLEEERAFFTKMNPVGFILFARNCKTPEQIKKLVSDLRACASHDDVLVLIDQEGGRVARLRPPTWYDAPAAARFRERAEAGDATAGDGVFENYRIIGAELAELGINMDCAPVLDLLVDGCHGIIGDRAFGCTPEMVAELGRRACEGLVAAGVLPVIKHIPGHGRAMVDSHESLPVVNISREQLVREDAEAFRLLSDQPAAMTAHITYTALDAERCATQSPTVISFIRNEVGFDGLLMTDDLSMKALTGTFAERARLSLDAGCDVLLHCNGKMEEMLPISEATPPMSAEAMRRLRAATALVRVAA